MRPPALQPKLFGSPAPGRTVRRGAVPALPCALEEPVPRCGSAERAVGPPAPRGPAPCRAAPAALPSTDLLPGPAARAPRGAGAAPARPAPRCRRTGRARPCRRAGPALPRGVAGLGCPGAAPHGRTRSARQPGPGPVAHGERGPAAARRPRSPIARRGMPGPRMPAWGILPVTLPAFTITGMWIV